ncbi:MAG: hypothetical protein LLG14_14505 [Nocardiaceae bacterium]|nr:hypothetical protein [Nocardiaceae bacterium]
MSDAADLRAEIGKLSRLLDVEAKSLAFLETAGWREIRQLRQLVSDHFFGAGEPRLRNLAAIAKLVPVQVIVKLAPLVFEPRMGAGLASLIDEDKALKLVPKLPPSMLAEAVPYIDPRRVGPLAAKIPVEVMREIVPYLVAANEHAAMGQFIDYVTKEQLDGLLPYIDDATLLTIIETAENRDQFNSIMPLVSDARIGRLITTAKELGQLPIIFELLEYVDPPIRAHMANIAMQQSDSVLESFLIELASTDRFELLLSAIPLMGRSELIRLTRNPVLTALPTLTSLFAAAGRTDDWAAGMRLLPLLPEASRSQLVASRLWSDADTIRAAANAAFERLDTEPELMVSFLKFADGMAPEDRRLFAEPLAEASDETFLRSIEVGIAFGGTGALLPLVGLLPEKRQAVVADIAANLDTDQLRNALLDANDRGVLPELLQVAAEMPRDAREKIVTIIADNPDDDLLSSSAGPEHQQETWNGLLKLTDDLPSQLMSKLGEQATMLSLDDVLPFIVKAGQATGRLATSFTLLDEINKIAEREGVPVEFALPAGLLKKVTDSVGNFAGADALGSSPADALVSVSLDLFKSASEATSKAASVAGEKTLSELAGEASAKVSGVAGKLFGFGKALRDAAAEAQKEPKEKRSVD